MSLASSRLSKILPGLEGAADTVATDKKKADSDKKECMMVENMKENYGW